MDASKLQCLLRLWGHSHEEDGGGVEVYRPVGFAFPLSRGREWLEFYADGSATFSGPGPDDRNRAARGSWVGTADDELEIHDDGTETPRHLTIVECTESVLKLRAPTGGK